MTDAPPAAGSAKVSRRTLAKGAAWSVPIVAVAATVPAYAASGALTLIQTGACKSPGASCSAFRFGYIFTFSASNSYPCAVTITNAVVTNIVGSTPGTLTITTPISVPQGTTPAFTITVNGTNSANVTFTANIVLTYTDCDGLSKTSTTSIAISGTPPDCACPGPLVAGAAATADDEAKAAESDDAKAAASEEAEAKDTEAPTAGSLAVTAEATGAQGVVSGASDAGGLDATPYSFRLDTGAWSAWQASSRYEWDALRSETSYVFQHRVRDAAGNVSTGTSVTKSTSAEAAPSSSEPKSSASPTQSSSAKPDPSPASSDPTPIGAE